MYGESAAVGHNTDFFLLWQEHRDEEHRLCAIAGVVDVEHVTSFVAIAQTAVTKDGGIIGRVIRQVIGSVVGIRRRETLIRFSLIQKHESYSTRLMLMEV